jgi:hypothetical protein
MMNMQSRNQYLKELRTEYLKTKSRKEKSKLLDEAGKRTGLNRKYLMEKLRARSSLDKLPSERKRRAQYYDRPVTAALAECWKIFDHACGQRLETSLKTEVDRLRKQGELQCSDIVAGKLKTISFRTIDEKLKHARETERVKSKYRPKIHPLLYQQVPVKVFDEQDRTGIGHLQTDLVEHCGASAAGQFINTSSNTDINFGWWEGCAMMGKSQEAVNAAIDAAWSRFPFPVASDHVDNGTEVLNLLMLDYCFKRNIDFSRSRPYKKNDNCLVENSNKTKVRRSVGYLRYDTPQELEIINDLYGNELRLYKNFFCPAMKLISKMRIKGHIKRKYDIPKTPYQRIMECKAIPRPTKQRLKKTYDSLNPARLKRGIDRKLNLLYKAYRAKKNQPTNVEISKIIKPRMVRKYIAQPDPVSVR